MQSIHPASKYESVDDLCVVTTYFNPCNYRRLLKNYLSFHDSLKQSQIRLFTVECAFGDAPFQLEPGPYMLQVRANSVLWQKERLLNIAFASVCKTYPKVAWIDADLFFTNPNWARQASALLEDYPIVQLFEKVIQLPPGSAIYDGTGSSAEGFAYIVGRDPDRLRQGFNRHGRPGLAWAARTSVVESGIFDACILGDGDHVMAHAMCGDWSSPCIDLTFFGDERSRSYFQEWSENFFQVVVGKFSYLPETILHLWHGTGKNRLKRERAERVASFGVDPRTDLRLNADLCWEWNTQRPMLHDYVSKYFELRKDDDDCPL